ncbi:hypothetical protein [Pseudotabrizicola formosa]|uniref:hypothetical protein n=1 Tax=Pseudotabrizicola formosa TaxID=2030009 RepID=UPI000CD169BD|nr:hypothetical protein [Pseudotabrizicola formosa]
MIQRHAVLTGDLILSTRSTAAQVDDTMMVIEEAIDRLGSTARFHRYRGDGWQAYVGAAAQGLEVMVFLAAQLRAMDLLSSRMALGIGDATGFDKGNLGTAGGMAFVASGRALDAMSTGQWLALAGAGTDPLHQALMAYLDAQVQGWSPEQAEAVALSLDPDGQQSQQVLAERLGISRQAFGARLSAAGFDLTRRAIRAFATQFAQGDTDG